MGATDDTKNDDQPGVRHEDEMSEAGRKLLAYHFARMLQEEPKVHTGGDPEAIHDMRVAIRRIRSMIRVFLPFYNASVIKPLNRHLREIARALGEVRDLDVFRLRLEDYIATRPEAEQEGLQPVLSDWTAREDAARAPLLRLLNSAEYRIFLSDFREFVQTPYLGAREDDDPSLMPNRVQDTAPRLIYDHYGAVRIYEMHLERATLDELHMMRIETKRLRYTLEAFLESLGDEALEVLDATKTLQDFLGNLQDERVAVSMLSQYLESNFDEDSMITPGAQAVRNYITICYDRMQTLREQVPEAWQKFNAPEIRRALALSVAAL